MEAEAALFSGSGSSTFQWESGSGGGVEVCNFFSLTSAVEYQLGVRPQEKHEPRGFDT